MSIKNPTSQSCGALWCRFQVFFAFLLLPLLVPLDVKADEREEVEVIRLADQLPAGVRRMHQALLQAARSGEVENMRDVLQMSELMPLINSKFIHDPVAHWKSVSIDNTAREFLALLTELLELPPVKIVDKAGEQYIWPYFSRKPLKTLSPGEIVQLYRLAPASKAAKMLSDNRYSFAQLHIGADGTWHSFDMAIDQ